MKKTLSKWETRYSEYWKEIYRKGIKKVFIKECKKFKKWEQEDVEFGERSSENPKKKLSKVE